MALSAVMGKMVDHPCRATGLLISFLVMGLCPMRLQAGSCMRIMSSSVLYSFSSLIEVCFFLCMLSCAILIGWAFIDDQPFILT